MALAKKELFDKQYVELANFAKCLAHPARIAIIRLLQDRDCMSCKDIVDSLPLSQSTVSQHLACLIDSQILVRTPHHNSLCYALDKEVLCAFCHRFACTMQTH